ncbi:cytosine permease [Caulobacter sp. UNC358MFTsu5.1]|uniref:cytosine permease n=1 Tax=Caulobacter sp. UNC358MFTsu5.1 TaxID=1449049 RepID=UPI0021008280|nr:cytosine permease [Caulobacter sp. UNC358MFTsu5.1]
MSPLVARLGFRADAPTCYTRPMAQLDSAPDAPDAYDPLTPVPAERRALGGLDAFSLWFSLGIGLLVLQAGAFLVPGLSLGAALAAIVVGSVLGALLLAAAGVVGADTGLSAMGSLRLALGARGAAVPAVLNAVQLTGWGAFEIIAMRDSADALVKQTFGVPPAVDPGVRRPGHRPGGDGAGVVRAAVPPGLGPVAAAGRRRLAVLAAAGRA